MIPGWKQTATEVKVRSTPENDRLIALIYQKQQEVMACMLHALQNPLATRRYRRGKHRCVRCGLPTDRRGMAYENASL